MLHYVEEDGEFLADRHRVERRASEYISSLSSEELEVQYFSGTIVEDFCEIYLFEEESGSKFRELYPDIVRQLKNAPEDYMK